MNNYMNQHMDTEQDTKKHTVTWFNNLRVDVQTEFILELISLRNKKKDITQANRSILLIEECSLILCMDLFDMDNFDYLNMN